MKRSVVILSLILLPIIALAQETEGDTYRLYYLGGQSNMEGYGYNSELPDSLNQTFDDVMIFHGNSVGDEEEGGGLGAWAPLKPGHGVGFESDGKSNVLSDRFGIELSFAKRLQELYPGQKIALIKYARGGSSIDSLAAGQFGAWEPDYHGETGINQYDHFMATMRNAMAVNDINGDGAADRLVPAGILWMQGESDGNDEEIAKQYYSNLKRLMGLIRASLRVDDLPVVIGKISDSWNDEEDGKVWDYGELVQYAQEKYARTDDNAAIIRQTRYYDYSDPWHYDSAGYIDFGKRFADKLYGLNQAEE